MKGRIMAAVPCLNTCFAYRYTQICTILSLVVEIWSQGEGALDVCSLYRLFLICTVVIGRQACNIFEFEKSKT